MSRRLTGTLVSLTSYLQSSLPESPCCARPKMTAEQQALDLVYLSWSHATLDTGWRPGCAGGNIKSSGFCLCQQLCAGCWVWSWARSPKSCIHPQEDIAAVAVNWKGPLVQFPQLNLQSSNTAANEPQNGSRTTPV